MSRKMKDSGIEWIGEIPKTWDTVKIKNLAGHKEGLFLDGDWIESDIITSEGVRYLTTGNIGEGYFKEQGDGFISEETLEKMNGLIVYPGDLVISRLNKPIGRACLLPDTHDKYVIAVDNVVLRPNPKLYNRLFLKFAMNIDGYSEEANMISRGATMPRISRTLLGNIKLPIPSSDEQEKIANFLDKEVAEIDHVLEKTRASIEEYKKYKQSIITEAVTKGLKPDVKMKDSGVEWIGEIPIDWRISCLRNVTEIGAGGTPNRNTPEYWLNGTIPWMSSGEINNEFIYDTNERITELGMKNSNAKILPVNTVMLGLIGQGKTKGLTAVLCIESTCNQNLAYLISKEQFVYYKYIFYCFKSMYEFIRGIVGESQAGIYQKLLKSLKIPLPQVELQREISDYLDTKSKEIDNLITQKIKLLIELETYKKSLIYECITGKREVI